MIQMKQTEETLGKKYDGLYRAYMAVLVICQVIMIFSRWHDLRCLIGIFSGVVLCWVSSLIAKGIRWLIALPFFGTHNPSICETVYTLVNVAIYGLYLYVNVAWSIVALIALKP